MNMLCRMKCVSSLLVIILMLVLSGCPRNELGGGLVVEPTSIDFGSKETSVNLYVWKTYTSTSIGPIIVESQVPWLLVENCTSSEDGCYSSGPYDRKKIKITVDREKTELGSNVGNLIVRATNAPAVTVLVTLLDLIKVDFDASNKFVSVNESIRFFNQSSVQSGNINKVTWDFGDGTTSESYNPTHFYQKPGNYTVTLTVETENGTEKRVKENFINVASGKLEVDFSASSQIVLLGEDVQFIDRSRSEKETITKRYWEFGDGKTSTDVNPRYRYSKPGIYTVSLTVYTNNQSSTLVKEGFITVQEGVAPVAKFSVSNIKPFVNVPVQFTDLSEPGTAPITEWLWEFGDGNTSDEQSPQYAFSRLGVQQVRLTVKNKFGGSSFTLPVEVIYMPPVADFAAEPLVSYQGENVLFVDLSKKGTERIIKWVWDFGDETTETIQYEPFTHENGNTNHVYTESGVYSVSLTVYTGTSSNNESSVTKESYITIHQPPVPKISVSTRSPLIQKETKFLNRTALGTETDLTYEWDFGDGSPTKITTIKEDVSHVYSEPGVYNVVLKVKTTLDTFVSDPVEVYVDAPPIPDFDYEPKKITIEDFVHFIDMSNSEGTRPIVGWVWSFGDNSEPSTMQNPMHHFSTPGKYKVELYLLFVHSKSGVQLKTAPISKTITVGTATPPVANFRVESPSAIVNSEVKFIDLSIAGTVPIAEWEWDFGDGGTSSEQSPIHKYSEPGLYTVKLKVRTAGGLESEVVKENCVIVGPYAEPLDIFVRERDPEYSWTAPTEYPVSYESGSVTIRLATAYITRMTSQAWRSSDEIYSGRIWKHNLSIFVPERLRTSTGFLFVSGGSINSSPPNEDNRLFFGQLAALTGSVIVYLDNVPNQPIVFMDDYDPEQNKVLKSRTEDDIIAYSYDKFMNEYKAGNYDYHWPLLFAMAKSAVRAMDTTQAILGNIAPVQFIVSGGSKRGWTTWLTGLTDYRVKAIAPLVIDVLNMDKQMEHHKKVYGYWAPSIYAYAQMKVFDRLISNGEGIPPEAEALLKLIDPYEYLPRTEHIPKYIINSSCDEFFVPDSARWYYDDLLGEKYINYIPNVNHSLGGYLNLNAEAPQYLLAWLLVQTQNIQQPTFTWERVNENKLRVKVDSNYISQIREVKLWKCTNPGARDYRKYKIDDINVQYESTTLQPISPGEYEANVFTPTSGWTAFFIQLIFNNPAKFQMAIPGLNVPPLVYTTPIFITPDDYPEFPSEIRRDPTTYPYPYLILRGSPYEMGKDYGRLMRTEIINHVNYVLNNLSQFGVNSTILNNVWNTQKNTIDERIREELQGISEGAGISYDSLGKLQLVELLSLYGSTRASGSLLWSLATNMPQFFDMTPTIQTYSLNRQIVSGGQQDYPVVVFYIPDQGFPHALFTFAGMVVSRAGVNAAGICYGDIPISGETVNAQENALSAFRSVLYDLNRLDTTIDWINTSSQGRKHTYLLGDGRYEQRGAKLLIDGNLRTLVRDYDTKDNYYPFVLSNVVYEGDTDKRDIYNYINNNYGLFVENGLYILTQKGAISGSNLMNLIIDATAFKGYVAFANGTRDASTQAYMVVDFQSILP
ncbi:MAG TPA: PhoPQ-activated protein PqaA family protein [Candidatus Hydrogenedens sp.]|nr:PhoPQ-activated protein PqaA family protein [Candidatus Hydrogenedens sp.]HOL20794.1 PhoPQ-activated protein PqaA family protein [Candidatus Hydrogenedens sp.]HPP57888.1 PhoPQ-activated protein PqaA family protein [Candidatus Hydrogenedens sp.]